MEYVTHNTANLDSSGSCLQGEIKATYEELRTLFGKPCEGDGYKVDAQWVIRFADGTLSTIYNWKDGLNYCGDAGTPVEDITEWHVGGMATASLDQVVITLDLFREGLLKPAAKPDKPGLDDMLGDVSKAREDMIASLRKHHGGEFADLVQLATIAQRQVEIARMLAGAALSGDVTEHKHLLAALVESMATLCASALDGAVSLSGIDVNKHGGAKIAEEIMFWAEKMRDAESSAAVPIIESLRKKMGGQ
jgi:hypothetical protein